jgi:hypothetical protein
MFIIFIFATFGLYLFNGMYEYRCRIGEAPVNDTWPLYPNHNKLCNPDIPNFPQCPYGTFCGSPNDHDIPWNETEIINVHFNYGMTGFDDIF